MQWAPRTASGMPYNWVTSLYRRGDTIVTAVSELRGPADAATITELVELSGDLTPKSISFGAGYKEAHERLEKLGRIDHKWSECQEQKHPAIIREWERKFKGHGNRHGGRRCGRIGKATPRRSCLGHH
jgi:hypothetical protein